jgi:aryl-alcohol dehydrogenase-like predicted oxidoreductase
VRYRTLSTTGVQVSVFSLGTTMFGNWGNPDTAECARMIRKALDEGINCIDTADVYSEGESEEIVGQAIRGRRDEVFLATKFHSPMGPGPNDQGNSRRWIMRAVEASLKRLGTDHIDLYQAHRPDPTTAIDETLDALTTLIRQGKILYAGSSTFPAWQIVEAQEVSRRSGLSRFVCEQPPYSLFARSIERDVLPAASHFGVAVVTWSPLAGGWLTGKYHPQNPPPPDSRAAKHTEYRDRGGRMDERYDLGNPANERKFRLIDGLREIAAGAGIELAHLALAFTLTHPAVCSTIIGPRTMSQLDGLLSGQDVHLDSDLLDAIDELIPPGSVINEADLGWDPPWLAASARRR